MHGGSSQVFSCPVPKANPPLPWLAAAVPTRNTPFSPVLVTTAGHKVWELREQRNGLFWFFVFFSKTTTQETYNQNFQA